MTTHVHTILERPIGLFKLIAICFIVSTTVLAGCSTSPKQPDSAANDTFLSAKNGNSSKVLRKLNRHYNHWKKTPYKLGGTSKRGIDCSGFVQVTYRDVFNKVIPRSTALQVKAGHNISRKNLKLGDLVFFRTGRRQRHVGIFIGNNRFMHASTSKGVMLSKLDSPYWTTHYWKAKRIITI